MIYTICMVLLFACGQTPNQFHEQKLLALEEENTELMQQVSKLESEVETLKERFDVLEAKCMSKRTP